MKVIKPKTPGSSKFEYSVLMLLFLFPSDVLPQEANEVPFEGGETALVRIEAEPREYINRLFTICGDIKTKAYHNYGYNRASGSHYSFELIERKSDSSKTGERAYLYLDREVGKAVSNRVVEQLERHGSDGGLFARVTVTIAADRFEPNGWNYFEVVDVQFLKEHLSGWDEGLVQWPDVPIAEKREWTDTKGRTIHARFKGIEVIRGSDLALLEKDSNETIKVNLMWLSDPDCEYIRKFQEQERLSKFHPDRFDQ